MKEQIFVSIFILVACIQAFSQEFKTRDNPCVFVNAGAAPLPCNKDYFELLFEDNFDGSYLDLSKWIPKVAVIRDFEFGLAKQWLTANNVEVNNGVLKLTAKRETGTHTYWIPDPPNTATATFDYTSGEVWTKYKFFYGKYEIKCRMPNGPGLFPAFWEYGSESSRTSELDFFDNMEGNLKWSYGNSSSLNGDGDGCRWDRTTNLPDFSQWHVFTCIFEPDRITWLLDNKVERVMHRYRDAGGFNISCEENYISPLKDHKSYPTISMQIIANMAIRSGASAPPPNLSFPLTMEVDYIRYYKRNNCYIDKSFPSTASLALDPSPDAYNYICGLHLTAGGGNVIVSAPKTLVLSGKNEVKLLPGFNAVTGSNFVAQVQPTAFSVTIGGPVKGNNTSTYTWTANPMYGLSPYTYEWNYSVDGEEYNGYLGNTASITNQLPYNQDLFLRVTVTSLDGQVAVDYFHTFNMDKPAKIVYRGDSLGDKPASLYERGEISVFPNPTNGIVNINLKNTLVNKGKIIVFNYIGQSIIEKQILNTKEEINLSEFKKGIYILKIMDESNNICYYDKVALQ